MRRGGRRALVAASVLALLCTPALRGSGAGGPQTVFFHANSLYGHGDYAGAVREYEQLIESGVHSGNVYFNLGNAQFKLGENGKAILNYVRARRFLPGDPDVQANLAYALSLSGAQDCGQPLWQSALFPLSSRLSTWTMVLTVNTLCTLLFLFLAVSRLAAGRRRWLHRAAVLLGAALVCVGTSLAHRVTAVEWQRHAVVTVAGETPVRFEPSRTGTVHFLLKQGAQVTVLDEREGWRQVSRCDGRRGWAESLALEEVLPTASGGGGAS